MNVFQTAQLPSRGLENDAETDAENNYTGIQRGVHGWPPSSYCSSHILGEVVMRLDY